VISTELDFQTINSKALLLDLAAAGLLELGAAGLLRTLV